MTQHELDVASFEKAKAFFITGAITDIEVGTTKRLAGNPQSTFQRYV